MKSQVGKNCKRGKVLVRRCPSGEVSWWGDVLVGRCPGGEKSLVGKSPGEEKSLVGKSQ